MIALLLPVLASIWRPVAVVVAIVAGLGGLYGYGHHEGEASARAAAAAATARAIEQQKQFDANEAASVAKADAARIAALNEAQNDTQKKVQDYEAELAKRAACDLSGDDVQRLRGIDGDAGSQPAPAAPKRHRRGK